MGLAPSTKFRLLKRRQQVAAVCYRIRKRGVEFLLVQTRGGRWIFPKGGAEPGLTHAQSAALEAFEEAGVHGRMEEIPFARYFRRMPDTATTGRPTRPELAVTVYLCEVTRLEKPQESNRNPTWFSAQKAKERLIEERAPEFGAELARIIDRAGSRIQRLRFGAGNAPERMHKDGLQKIRIEPFEHGGLLGDLRERALASAAIKVAVQAQFRRVSQISTPDEIRRPVRRLGTGAASVADTAHNITAIDSGRKVDLLKPGALRSSKRKMPNKLVR